MSILIRNRGNTILLNANNTIQYDDICCCECAHCAPGTAPEHVTTNFTSNLNTSGTCLDCGDWVASWRMGRIHKRTVDRYFARFPSNFPVNDIQPRDLNCWYRATEGLPCGASYFLAEIFQSHPDAVLILYVGWSDGTFFNIQITWNSTPGNNCRVDFGNPGVPDGVGISFGGVLPCDWLGLISSLNWPHVVITAA